MFIIIDGIDGSGKSTIMEYWTEFLAEQGKKIFFLKPYWSGHQTHPTPPELESFDVIVSAEPTMVWIGAAIREEMIRHGANYSARSIAHAYALDRLILYKRLLLPLLAVGKTVIQDRSVSTSLCYQPLQDGSLTMADVAAIEGNAFALEHAPDHLVIADVDADTALLRLKDRVKKDAAIFEQKQFLEQARARFFDREYQGYFTSRQTKIHTLNCGVPIGIMKQASIQLLNNLLT